MDVFEAMNTRISVAVLREPGPTDRQWEILLRGRRGAAGPWPIAALAVFHRARRSARVARRRHGRGLAPARKPVRLRKRSTANGANPRGRQPCLSWPSSPSRIPACPKSSKFWRAAPRRRIFCSPPMPLALARFGARARRPITTMSRERSACPRRGASSPSSIFRHTPCSGYAKRRRPDRQAQWSGGRPHEDSPCREAGDQDSFVFRLIGSFKSNAPSPSPYLSPQAGRGGVNAAPFAIN